MDTLFTGGYEDLIVLIMRLEARMLAATSHTLPVKPPWKRLLLEFPLNLLAAGYGKFLKLLPHTVAEGFFLKTFDLITYNKYQSVGISISENSNNASILYRFIKSTYSEPSLWTITSHPPVLGEIRDLNVGLMGASFRLMRAVHGDSRPFRIMLAVDVMALDTLLLAEEAIYAGAMGAYHVAMDRLPSSRNAMQKLLMGGTSYDSAAWRLFDALRSRHNVTMIPAGGVAETARLIYTTRELIWRLRQETREKPWEVLAALKAADPQFAEFLNQFAKGGNAWKRLESYLIARLARDPLAGFAPREAIPPCLTGKLEDSDKEAVFRLFAAFGVPPAAFDGLFADFAKEFLRITPYRTRLFRLIVRKVVRNGVPVLILPLDFSLTGDAPILAREPLALVPGPNGDAEAWQLTDGRPAKISGFDESFFAAWGTKTYSA